MRRTTWPVCAVAVLTLGLGACTAGDDAPAVAAPAPWTAAPDAPEPTLEDPGPVVRDAGYRDAVATFGESEVAVALGRAARVARLSLADCEWWAEGALSPELATLLTPDFLLAVQADVQEMAGDVPMLLSDLPEDDGNGHALADDLAGGCDDGGPLLHAPIDTTVHVGRAGAQPVLVVDGHYGVNVSLGSSDVSANQDWVFTMARTDAGWQVSGATPSANTNWALWRAG
ncbi:hypothetical protein [Blastococcus sp. TF02A-35]|uniref:hypothetical protein n=1 Tax=Blastococcus sp. TF02A-35 TaxID=2559612 RepID=UPI001073670A|nr:hypothetical protein [Blastococcus sp. TF02A_35]TFV52505.1 hypothetical protein E4P43_05800 [Blastococcus sp. TF02A_35]